MKLFVGILLILLQCTSVDKKTYLKGFYVTTHLRPHQQLTYAEKYGYNSECLVLMEGPVPSRMEPCAIGDRRSGRDMYQETEVLVAGDFFAVDWPIAGYNYALHVNNDYYQNVILYTGSYQRRDYSRFPHLYVYRGINGNRVIRNTVGYPYPMSTGIFMNGR
ncbi:hypothetical protein EHQ30_12985 [Leptospira brenneri]|uniref:Uncharacterized protein n=1 Tax=Leptospira brenneri TaxID=2023182 RepID=A0A5F1Z696_9LEPT|nr:hypothetical protein [Leptospira brenneri]TGK92757.1 hypothetical protein EHQ30_12985 [Leptospira brenneri]